jgi:predicted DNA-binding protein (UPF0251 family)
MPRPVKWRKVGFLPQDNSFIPEGKSRSELEEVVLKVEELEAMRLKDLEKLNQEQCAERMNISRQTFQLIIDDARKKVTEALVEGKAISIRGGKYTVNICSYNCRRCGEVFDEPFEKKEVVCPQCKSEDVECLKEDNFCKKRCTKKWCCLKERYRRGTIV